MRGPEEGGRGGATASFMIRPKPTAPRPPSQVAILSLYNQVNKRLPGWQDPP